MIRFIIYRFLQLIPVMLLVSIVAFAFIHALPGDVIDAMAGDAEAHDPERRAALEKQLGLDQPIYVQYFTWLGKIVLYGDFGKSITTRRSIGVELFKRIPATVYLAVVAVLISLVIAVPLGTIAALKHRTLVDYTVTTAAVTGVSIPNFWFAILCVLFFALYLDWLPASEYVSPFDHPWLGLKHLLLPGAALGVRLAAITTRLTRSSMLDEIRKDYVDTARSVGRPEWRVIFKYTLKDALIPTVTVQETRENGKQRVRQKTSLPGYIFVEMEMNEEAWHLVKDTPKVTQFIGNQRPQEVRPQEIEEQRRRVVEGAVKPKPRVNFDVGDEIRVIDGAFANFSGTVEEVKPDKQKLKVKVSIFGRATPVELDFSQVEKRA